MEEGSKRTNVRVLHMRRTLPAIRGFEDGRGPHIGKPLESQEGKTMYSTLEPPDRNAILLAPQF